MATIVHDPNCQEPLNEHTGNEPCIRVVEEVEEIAEPIAHYTQGPQGNQVADYVADYHARYGRSSRSGPLGSSGITDRRDNRDAIEVGTTVLSERETLRNRNGSDPHNYNGQ